MVDWLDLGSFERLLEIDWNSCLFVVSGGCFFRISSVLVMEVVFGIGVSNRFSILDWILLVSLESVLSLFCFFVIGVFLRCIWLFLESFV